MNHVDKARTAIVVGAGPVGCLAAITLAKMGWNVDIYEARPDLRLPSSKAAAQQRSINLAISSRGIAALQAIDPAITARFLQTTIPMRGRMIHDISGNQHSQPYDKDGQVGRFPRVDSGVMHHLRVCRVYAKRAPSDALFLQCISSIDRALLNEGLLEEASAVPNIRLFFSHKVLSIDFDHRTMTIRNGNSETDIRVIFDLCIGADGSYSIVRRQLMRVVRMNFQQEYIPHEYIELKMPAGCDEHGQPVFLLDPNHLHIWPRHSFMLIALPNKDKSFTCTLFAPTVEFDRLVGGEAILSWFRSYFPDALLLLGEDKLLNDLAKNPRSPLISIKANPYHYKDRCVILGDAAHSMVPFYGQGLNCGLEDVRVLRTLLLQEGVGPFSPPTHLGEQELTDTRLSNALSKYTETRHEDLVAICELAMDNYVEMRHSVTTPGYLFKKALDNLLYAITSNKESLDLITRSLATVPFPSPNPTGWLPLYTMITFRPDISYATAREKAGKQSVILSFAGRLGTVALSATGFYVTLHVVHWLRGR